MKSNLLDDCGVPGHVRWYARKCEHLGVAYSKYAGWHIFTRPTSIDGGDFAGAQKLFSLSEIYLRKLDNIAEAASESRIYINCPITYRHANARISAPYVSLRHFSAQELLYVTAEHYVLYYGVPDIANLVSGRCRITYICDLPLFMAMPGGEIYGAPEFSLKDGCEYDDSALGFGKYHLIALGMLPRGDVEEICAQEGSFAENALAGRCMRRPPRPCEGFRYPGDLPELSYSDLKFLLANKSPADICESIRRPFLHYYPGVDYSANFAVCELVARTEEAVNALKVEGYPNCA